MKSDIGGYSIVPRWLLSKVIEGEVNPASLPLWCILSDYANREDYAWPSMATLASDLKASEKTVRRCLQDLERVGALRVEKRFAPNGRQSSNGYRLLYLLPSLAGEGGGSLDSPPMRVPEMGGGGSQTSPPHKLKKDPIEEGEEETPESPPPPSTGERVVWLQGSARKVMEYLNDQAGKRFDVKIPHKNLTARLREAPVGEREDVLRIALLVVEHRSMMWKGDARMRPYLRAETLFAQSHWQSYVNDALEWEEAGKPGLPEKAPSKGSKKAGDRLRRMMG